MADIFVFVACHFAVLWVGGIQRIKIGSVLQSWLILHQPTG